MAPLVSKRSTQKDPKQVEDNLDYDDSETDHTIDVCKPLNGIEKLKRNVRWSPTLTENMLIERRIDVGQGTKLRMWYQVSVIKRYVKKGVNKFVFAQSLILFFVC